MVWIFSFNLMTCKLCLTVITRALLFGYLESPPHPRSNTLVYSSLHQSGCLSAQSIQCAHVAWCNPLTNTFVNTCYKSTSNCNIIAVMPCCWHVFCMSMKRRGFGQVSKLQFPKTDEATKMQHESTWHQEAAVQSRSILVARLLYGRADGDGTYPSCAFYLSRDSIIIIRVMKVSLNKPCASLSQ